MLVCAYMHGHASQCMRRSEVNLRGIGSLLPRVPRICSPGLYGKALLPAEPSYWSTLFIFKELKLSLKECTEIAHMVLKWQTWHLNPRLWLLNSIPVTCLLISLPDDPYIVPWSQWVCSECYNKASFISLNHLPKNYVLSSRYRQLLDCILERRSECSLSEALDEDSHTDTCHYITTGGSNGVQNEWWAGNRLLEDALRIVSRLLEEVMKL